MLVNVYFGLFKVKEVDKIKSSMTDLFQILLDRIAPPTVKFDLTENNDKVTLVITKNSVGSPLNQKESAVQQEAHCELETTDDTIEWIATYSAASNIQLSRPTMTRLNTNFPNSPPISAGVQCAELP